MKNTSNHHGILFEDGQLGPFPMHRLKHVDKPTNRITDNVQRIDSREMAFARAERGDFGPAAQRNAPRLAVKYPLSAAQTDIQKHLASTKYKEVAAAKAPIPEDPKVITRHIKRLGYFLGADVMGVCQLPKSAVYSHDPEGNPIDINYRYAIVLVMSKELRTINASTGYDWIGDPVSFQAYNRLALAARIIANYIRRLGYPAAAQHESFGVPGGYQVLMPPLLLWAGIGEVCRAGIILNPFLGIAFKAAAVLTDFPLVPDKPIDFELQDYCQRCKICAEICPSKAIPMGDKVMYNGYETWKLDEKRCCSFSLSNKKGTICEVCVKVCPWTNPRSWSQKLVRLGLEHSSLARRLAIKFDLIHGPGKANEEEKWWFDLEDVNLDGVLKTPSSNK